MKRIALLLIALLLALPAVAESGELIVGDPTAIGSVVLFGHYDQDNHPENGAEAIQWIVLESDGETAKLISQPGLDAKAYNTVAADVTWETCSLREWLNGEFLEAAFAEEEQALLVPTVVTADANPESAADPGADTEDRVFLLSIKEVNECTLNPNWINCYPSYTAKGHGLRPQRSGACWWWLRTPGSDNASAAFGSDFGTAFASGLMVSGTCAVRPVIVVKLP